MAMSAKLFDSLSLKDFENGAIRNEIRSSLKELERISNHFSLEEDENEQDVQVDAERCDRFKDCFRYQNKGFCGDCDQKHTT